MCIEEKYWVALDKANLVGEELCQSQNDYKTGSIFHGLFQAPKIKYCLTINELGIEEEHKIFKVFNDGKRLLDRSHFFIMLKGKKISATLPKSWEKAFINGIIIPTKMRFCNECNDKRMCNKCINQNIENKEFEVILNLLKREAAHEFGHMFPYFNE